MATQKLFDPITLGIVAVTFLLTLLLLVRSGIVGGSDEQQKIAILDTGPLLDTLNSAPGSEYLVGLKKKIDKKTELLTSQGFIVLRSEVVRGAPSEFYVTLED